MNRVERSAFRPRYSIVIPTFDRANTLPRAVESALVFARHAPAEIVVVDDASRDGTVEQVKERYASMIAGGILKLVCRKENGGATAAKNDGARSAAGEWLIFLDSDDELTKDAAGHIERVIAAASAETHLVFFRCVDTAGKLIGPPVGAPRMLDLPTLVRQGTPGECLPVVRRESFLAEPYDSDLRGFEALAYARLVRRFGHAHVVDAIIRIYHVEGDDRLSTAANRLRRGCQMALGFRRLLMDFRTEFEFTDIFRLAARMLIYGGFCTIRRAWLFLASPGVNR